MTKKTIKASKYNINHTMIDRDALYVIERLQKKGFQAYIVGGGIRDLLLNKEPKDFDIVTDATPEMVRKIFRNNSLIIGRRFKIVHIIFDNINPDKMINNRPLHVRHIIEVSTYRSSAVNINHVNEHGKIVVDNNYGDQEQDSARRDFTINSLYYDPIKEIIIDYHNGIKDIEKKIIRMIGDPYSRYVEDPVRLLRAIRLSVKLGLNIEKKTAKCFPEIAPLLTHENRGRLYEEMLKILLSGDAYNCIQALKELKLPKQIFPLFDKLFFNNTPDELALNITLKTDQRLKETTDVSTMFILAGLLWNMVYNTWQKLLYNGASPRQALSDAISEVRFLAYNSGITKNAYSSMRDIWLLQYDFENPEIKRIDNLIRNHRFRQAWHLYSARNQVNQVDAKLYAWWETFITADNETRLDLFNQLKQVYTRTKKPKRRKKSKTVTKE